MKQSQVTSNRVAFKSDAAQTKSANHCFGMKLQRFHHTWSDFTSAFISCSHNLTISMFVLPDYPAVVWSPVFNTGTRNTKHDTCNTGLLSRGLSLSPPAVLHTESFTATQPLKAITIFFFYLFLFYKFLSQELQVLQESRCVRWVPTAEVAWHNAVLLHYMQLVCVFVCVCAHIWLNQSSKGTCASTLEARGKAGPEWVSKS